MIECERQVTPAAILASVSVTPEDVFPRENDSLERDFDIERQLHDAWKGHRGRHGMYGPSVVRFDQFRFPEIQQDDCLLHVNHTHWLVILI